MCAVSVGCPATEVVSQGGNDLPAIQISNRFVTSFILKIFVANAALVICFHTRLGTGSRNFGYQYTFMSVFYFNGNVRFHGVVVGCVIRCEDCRIGFCSFGLWSSASVFPCPAFRQCYVGKRFSHLCSNAGRHRIGRICFCNRQIKGTLGVPFISDRA